MLNGGVLIGKWDSNLVSLVLAVSYKGTAKPQCSNVKVKKIKCS